MAGTILPLSLPGASVPFGSVAAGAAGGPPGIMAAFATTILSKLLGGGSKQDIQFQPPSFNRNRRRLLTLEQAMVGIGAPIRTREPFVQSNPILEAFLYGSR